MPETANISGTIKRTALWLIMAVLFSCENPLLFNRCPDCIEYEPIATNIKVRFSPFSSNVYVTEVRIYQGEINDSILAGTYDVNYEEWSFRAGLNSRYTVAVTYYWHGSTITAIDSTIPKVRRETAMCDQPCYLVIDNRLDLRIKRY